MSTQRPTSNVPYLRLMISTEKTLADAAARAREKAAAFFSTTSDNITLELVRAERDVDLEDNSTYGDTDPVYVETVESYHCSFEARVKS